MLQVVGHRLLIDPDQVEKVSKGGIVLAVDERLYREATMKGTVVQIGPTAFDFNERHNKPWCEVGDKIIYARHAGKFVEDPDQVDEHGKPKQYYVINDEDVQVIVKEEVKND